MSDAPRRAGLSRRDVLKLGLAGSAGLVLACRLDRDGPPPGPPSEAPFAPNAWIRIDTTGLVTVVLGQSEMGQGVSTALPRIVAEELDADWERVAVEQAPAHPAYDNPLMARQRTAWSSSVRAFWRPLREAGAAARQMLVEAAAERWQVAPETCRAARSEVLHDATGRRLGYGDLAEAAGKRTPPRRVRLKPPAEFTLVGRDVPRRGVADIVSGRARYGMDVQLPGMLRAAVARPPRLGARVQQFDATAALALPGVRGVEPVSGGIAVLADSYWTARQGRDRLDIRWSAGTDAPTTSATEAARLEALLARDGVRARRTGDAERELARAARRIEATYRLPYLAHAPMEPLSCTAWVRDGRCDVWAATQDQTGARDAAAAAAELPTDRVTVHTTLLGGGFGRRVYQDFVDEAVRLARASGQPVQVIWSREEDLRHDFYRPATHHRLAGGLDGDGSVVAWRHHLAGAGPDSAADLPYAIPHQLVTFVREDGPVPTGIWRSVDHSQNTFVVESFADELAAAAGQDPLAWRLGLVRTARQRAVLEHAADRAGWHRPPAPGRALGLALHQSVGTVVAQVAEVSLDEAHGIRVHRVVCAIDCGQVIHPDGVVAQVEGAVAYGLSAALWGRIDWRDGAVSQSNFHDYRVVRLPEMPQVEVVLVASDEPPGGVGEPPLPPLAPAVTNAWFRLTGRRVRQLPLVG